jgi:GntR family transcriptional regulator
MHAPSFKPLYQQISTLLLESLDRGEWRPGELIPSEFELAARYRVSQGTVRKALDSLAHQNLVVRRQGKGTFVATHGNPGVRFRFLRLAPDSGASSTPERQLLDFKRLRAPSEVAKLLQLRSGDGVVMLKRLLVFGGDPLILEETWLPGSLFRGLTAAAIREHRGALYNLFETQFGTRMVRANEKVKAMPAEQAWASALNVAAGHSVLHVERLSFTYADRPAEWRRSIYKTDRHHYRSELG